MALLQARASSSTLHHVLWSSNPHHANMKSAEYLGKPCAGLPGLLCAGGAGRRPRGRLGARQVGHGALPDICQTLRRASRTTLRWRRAAATARPAGCAPSRSRSATSRWATRCRRWWRPRSGAAWCSPPGAPHGRRRRRARARPRARGGALAAALPSSCTGKVKAGGRRIRRRCTVLQMCFLHERAHLHSSRRGAWVDSRSPCFTAKS